MNPDQDPKTEAFSDEIVFVEHGMEHPFQHEGADFSRDREGRFLRLNFVTVYVRDQERSKKFFVEQLGFRLMIDVKFPSGYRWIEVAPPDGTARLALVVQAPGFMDFVVPGQSSLITFMAEDVEARYREWSERGVRFPTAPFTPEWGGKFCRFQDPDGNLFGLSGFNGVTLAIEKRREAEARHREAERLAAQELDLAKQVQMRLLPQAMRAIPTVDCAGICLQARAVGGDYYDFLYLGKDRLALIVGDIAGKGMGAALLMANLQATLRSQSARLADCPERALTLVNRMLFENTEPRAYTTLFYAEYDSVSRRLRYANCGHLPGLLFRGTQVEKLLPANTVIGLFDVWECSVSETSMASGDVLVLYTDGVTEATGDSEEEFGEARLIDAVFKNRSLSAQDLVQAISAEVLEFGSGKQNDDITIAVAKRLPEGS
jgi:phosphoserine phosphatase RsbU/P